MMNMKEIILFYILLNEEEAYKPIHNIIHSYFIFFDFLAFLATGRHLKTHPPKSNKKFPNKILQNRQPKCQVVKGAVNSS